MSGIEDVLPLAPLQEGMYFHALFSEDAVDVYHAQIVLHLEGALDHQALRRAAEALLQRHQSLRTGFRRRRNGQPIQVVHRTATVPWWESDLSGTEAQRRDAELAELEEGELAAGFDLAKPSLLRFALVRVADEAYRLILTNHHIALDGWSVSILVRELFALYGQIVGDPEAPVLAAAAPYRAYMEWLMASDADAAENAWLDSLAGLERPTLLVPTDLTSIPPMPERMSLSLPRELGGRLSGATRAHGLTMNTFVQGAWALLLSHLTGEEDVVFGATVSGRPPEVPGVESMAGMFINTVPVRVRIDRDAPLIDNLRAIQDGQSVLIEHQHVQLGRVRRRAGLGELFDTVTVFENYPGGFDGGELPGGLRLVRASGQDAAHYPLRLAAGMADGQFEADLEYRPDMFDAHSVRKLGHRLGVLLGSMTDVGTPTSRLAGLPEDERGHVPRRPEVAGQVAPPRGPQDPRVDHTPPRTSREEILCGLFAELLGVQRVGPETSFFDLGGHSLLAIRLFSQIKSVFGIEFPIRAVFEAPTARALASRIDGQARARTTLVPVPRPEKLPLSYAQRRLWFLHQVDAETPLYNLPVALRISGGLDPVALEAALRDVVERHESLRTVFPVRDHHPYQHILDPDEAAPELDTVPITEAGLDRALATAAARPFDLVTQPPIRAHLYELGHAEHVLLLVIHHIATDGWSSAPLTRDLATAYAARKAATAPAWQPLRIQYVDHCLTEKSHLGHPADPDSVISRQLAFWRDELTGLPEHLDLPYDRRPSASATHRGGTVRFALDARTHQALVELAAQCRATVFMVVQAGVAALLTRFGAGDDIPLGTVTAGRTDPVLDDLVGFFVNPLVLRADVSGDPNFRTLVERIRESDLAAYSHQDVPFERVVEAVNPGRTVSGHPLFQVMLAFQHAGNDIMMPGLDVVPETVDTGTARLDLAFNLGEKRSTDGTPEGIEGQLEFSSDAFTHETAERLAGGLARLLSAAVRNPSRPVGGLDVLEPAEQKALLSEWSGTEAPVERQTWPELFEAQVRRTPDAAAIDCDGTTMTYLELNERSNRLARYLIRRGVGPEQIVALAVPRSATFAITVLGVVKAGAAYLQLDLDYPAERIRHMLSEADPALVIATTGTAVRLPIPGTPLLVLDSTEFDDVPDTDPTDDDRTLPLRLDSPAYAVFTSGSTGRPRAVVVTHAGIADLAANQRSAFGAGPGSRVLQLVSPSFDVIVAELCMALLSGGCLVMPGSTPFGDELVSTLAQERITHTHVPAAILTGLPRTRLPHLTTLITGAEACPPDVIDYWSRDRLLVNAYGPTEATVDVTFFAVDQQMAAGPTPIGRPIPNVRVHVLDAYLRPVPPGAVGELYIAGKGVARGYLNEARATSERFVPDMYGEPGGRMYRTGDLARLRPGGVLEFAGRADDQVKVRGFRVEPGEIEAVLREHPAVSEVAVIVQALGSSEHLAAYIVSEHSLADTGDLRAHAASRLPEYMVPSAFTEVEELALTPNGKLDRSALPSMAPLPRATGAAPRSPLEHILCEIFAETLGVAEVGPEDNFFELGGHSLLAARMISRIREALGGDPTIPDLFAAPTPESLLRRLGSSTDSEDAFRNVLPLRSAGTRYPLFCLHPIAGTSWAYTALLRSMGPEHPVYGLQARGLDGGELPSSLDQFIGDYVEQIRAVQPSGPYHLVGWSFGGNIAHLVATRLRREGDKVDLLALLDAYPPEPGRPVLRDERHILTDMYEGYTKQYGTVRDGEPSSTAELRERVAALVGRGTSELRHFDERRRTAVVDIMVNTARIAAPVEPTRFDGDVLLVVATRNRADWAVPESWSPYVSGAIQTHEVDCAHIDMLSAGPASEIGPLLTARVPVRASASSNTPAQGRVHPSDGAE